ncbi:universal stress protein [Histidinibacterium aquaticum]|uniref:Universal stress protein n=1 Tax=Histidinibacterium aquaticum TaxID=2613962 RepID=A0A5J5GF26_9RHOB|nr:universal stress protein [Histidinibacterium aquaticum]KAA9006074.1 universal stress protein [Histidinibacterium aquaticum]
MSYKTISTVVTDRQSDRDTLHAALSLAETLEAHLDVFGLAIDPTRYEPMPAGAAAVVLESGLAEARERAADLCAWADRELPPGRVRYGTEPVVLPRLGIDGGLGRMLRYSDLVVARRPYGDGAGPLHAQVLEAALFQRGVPCLVVPPGVDAITAPKRVAVAWDDSDESLAAIRAALPLLMGTELVQIVIVDPPAHSPDRSDPGGVVAQMLARHGIHTEITILSRTTTRIADALLRFAADKEINLFVMGGYGHSRMREALFGGPTRHMLEEAALPLLMAH